MYLSRPTVQRKYDDFVDLWDNALPATLRHAASGRYDESGASAPPVPGGMTNGTSGAPRPSNASLLAASASLSLSPGAIEAFRDSARAREVAEIYMNGTFAPYSQLLAVPCLGGHSAIDWQADYATRLWRRKRRLSRGLVST